jgi:FixJ family two-component response regulator
MAARVFVVDDDGPVRRALGRLFRTAGYAVQLFASAEEYLAHAPAERPACLVLDMRMPGMGGLALQRVLGGTASLPIIFVTGHADDEACRQALAAGAIAVLQKPLDERVLLDAVKTALGPPGP